jgi:DNA-binding response OmpR family regulator
MAKSSGPGPSPRFLLIGQGHELADALRDSFGKSHEVVQAADFEEALRAIAEGGADVVLLSTAVGDPEAVRTLAELLKALADKRT